MLESRWRKVEDTWLCALHGRVLSFRQDSNHLYYQAAFPESPLELPTPPSSAPSSESDPLPEDNNTEALVHHYLNLSPNLTELYEQWSTVDANFRKKAPRFAGVRILKQDAWEALVGFICSSNNNIIRISQMVCHTQLMECRRCLLIANFLKMEKLCIHYGPLLGYIGTTAYYDMPSPSVLAEPKVETHLRQLGFGYRAKYLYQTAVQICHGHQMGWLDHLRNPESPVMGCKVEAAGEMQPRGREGYRLAHEELLTLQGVGPKVADCVCLMGLGWGEAVPVDTHGMSDGHGQVILRVAKQYVTVWQIAQRDYKFGKGKHSSLTKATYDAVGDRFRSLWGKEAGWAHSVLFTADLRVFSERLLAKIEVNEVKVEGADTEQEAEIVSKIVEETKIKIPTTVIKRELDAGEQPEYKSTTIAKEGTRLKRRKIT